ncbi:hypothetical protein EXIGLDRAFT_452880 [Exidia glandulosa HHB12029]|uniref:Uncharacterized protein n=1 Tax=Exidia glandulosa HHB12029 TaxID=1314781 RepID=A0A165K6Z9_EXIGL|nr:hypothetical protein EXIGLDRAFT_452880 [Exidia glandulosa HHB12029]
MQMSTSSARRFQHFPQHCPTMVRLLTLALLAAAAVAAPITDSGASSSSESSSSVASSSSLQPSSTTTASSEHCKMTPSSTTMECACDGGCYMVLAATSPTGVADTIDTTVINADFSFLIYIAIIGGAVLFVGAALVCRKRIQRRRAVPAPKAIPVADQPQQAIQMVPVLSRTQSTFSRAEDVEILAPPPPYRPKEDHARAPSYVTGVSR